MFKLIQKTLATALMSLLCFISVASAQSGGKPKPSPPPIEKPDRGSKGGNDNRPQPKPEPTKKPR